MHNAKMNAAKQAMPLLEHAEIIGMGTGSTVECLLELIKDQPWGLQKTYVASSDRTYLAMLHHGFLHVHRASEHSYLDLYIDGADWIDPQGIAIKGYGGALTQEKLLASMASKRIAIVDGSKMVPAVSGLSQPLPIEVLPIARSYVARLLVAKGWRVVYREGIVTDQGNVILDLYDYHWESPLVTERELKWLTGVVESGLFARDAFHTVFVGS